MDNHMHALAVPPERDSLARYFAGTNHICTQHTNHKQGRSGRLWQNRFFSCPVDKDEYLWPVLRYIDRNPVRAKAVHQAWEYAWSSARHHIAGEADALLNEPDWLLAELGEQKYRNYLRDEAEEVALEIRRTTATGRPLGSAAFTSALESRLDRVISVQKRGRPRAAAGK
jgi:putative transposase